MIIILGLFFILHSPADQISKDGFKTFNSLNEIKQFVEKNQANSGEIRTFFEGGPGIILKSGTQAMATDTSSGTGESAGDYSQTNIQVEGVDEANIIKNDGKYIYAVAGGKVFIIDAYPADNMKILSEIDNFEGYVSEIFINEEKLIIFSEEYGPILYVKEQCRECEQILSGYQEPRSVISVYDISDKDNPELKDEISLTGNYFDSRMIGNYVYVVANQYLSSNPVLPSINVNNNTKIIEPTEIYYQDIEDYSFQYTIVLAIDLEDISTSEKVMITGSTQNIYVSQNNIFTTFTDYSNRILESNSQESERTSINKISIDKLNVDFVAVGNVPGHILNQFSMDEYNGNFRIATTVGVMWNEENPSKNNVYVLNENLELIGELEDLAPGEKIYSVRFMGNRGYIVTFKKVDPLFVIDLSNPDNPEVLGKLKIPGYSDYLHPYDENHIIGIGKDAIDVDENQISGRELDFAWYQGVKVAIFDVTDVETPIELHKIVIGDRGTDSEALYEHKAFLFDKEKGLMVLPITLAIIEGEHSQTNSYGNIVFQGAQVYKVNLEDGFELVGQISHYDEGEVEDKSGYYWYGNKNIRRSLYMDDTLYTFSNEMLKANSLWSIDEVSFVEFPIESYYGREVYY